MILPTVGGRTPPVTIGASFLLGLVGSLILAIVPSALSDQHGELRAVALSEGNVIASLVAVAAPLLVGWFAHAAGGWRLALGLVAVAPILLYLGFGKAASSMAASTQPNLARTRQSLPLRYWAFWAAIVLAVSVEFCMISWSADYLRNVLRMSTADSAQAVSLFFAGMVLGRLAGSRLVQRFSTLHVVVASILIASIGFLVFWRAGIAALGLAGLFVTVDAISALASQRLDPRMQSGTEMP